MRAAMIPLPPVDPSCLRAAPVRSSISRTETGWRVLVDLPGSGPDDVTVDLCARVLTVRARVAVSAARPEGGTLTCVFAVPDGVPADAVTAAVRDGVLTLEVPAPSGQRVQIPVTATA